MSVTMEKSSGVIWLRKPSLRTPAPVDDPADLAITICHLVHDGTDRLGVSDIAGMVGCLDP